MLKLSRLLATNVLLLLSKFVLGEQVTVFKMASSDPGTVKIGLVFPGHQATATQESPCGSVDISEALVASQFRRIIEDVNNAKMLPYGIKLGYEIFDSCGSPNLAVGEAFSWLIKSRTNNSQPIAVVVGSGYSRVSKQLGAFLSLFGIPLVDYGATSSEFSNPSKFPLYSRVVASDEYMAKAMTQLVAELKWNCVHVLYSEGEYGANGAEIVSQYLLNASKCIANGGPLMLPLQETDRDDVYDAVVDKMLRSRSVRAVVCFCEDGTIRGLLKALKKRRQRDPNQLQKFFLIAGDAWGSDINLDGLEEIAKHSISFRTHTVAGKALSDSTGRNADVIDWVKRALQRTPMDSDIWLEKCLEKVKQCTINATKETDLPFCNLAKFKEGDLPQNDWLALLSNAVYAAAFGLESFFVEKCQNLKNSSTCSKFDVTRDGFRLYEHISNATFRLENGENFTFYRQRDGHPQLEVYKFISGTTYEKIGNFNEISGLNLTCDREDLAFNMAVPGASCVNTFCNTTCVPNKIIHQSIFSNRQDVFILPPYIYLHPPITPTDDQNRTTLIAVTALLSIGIIVLSGAVVGLLLKRKNRAPIKKHQTPAMSELQLAGGFDDDKLSVIAKNTLSSGSVVIFGEVIQHSRTGVFFKGIFTHYAGIRQDVAVKILKPTSSLRDLVMEGLMMRNFYHDTVAKFHGFLVEGSSLQLVVEYMPDGNLRDFLQSQRDAQILPKQRVNFCQQICCAMEHIASSNCVHRDLACRSVLVRCLPYTISLKISDFGLCRHLKEDDYINPLFDNNDNETGERVPLSCVRWWPPEALRKRHPIFVERSDVWSFGVVCWEIFSNGREPFDAFSDDEEVAVFQRNESLLSQVLERPECCTAVFYKQIMLACWERCLDQRPRFQELASRLQNVY